MPSLKEKITENLDRLPESMLNEVFDFIEFLTWKTSGQKEEPLLTVAGILSGKSLSAEDTERELYDDEK